MFVKLMVGLHANNILKLENHKYKKNQPGREYCGTISARDLFTLRNTTIPAAYIPDFENGLAL